MSPANGDNHTPKGSLAALALGALGVVFGDIGTSPLYSVRECFHGHHGVPLNPDNIRGVLSLIVWALLITISAKYLAIVMRADNRGEGGILALMAMVRKNASAIGAWRVTAIVWLGIFGAALLYGDGMITPAISVLSAVEGLEVVTHSFGPFVIPVTVLILVLLFAVQSRGTAGIGAVFGPIMLLWFGTLAALGISGIVRHPGVLAAVNPLLGFEFFLRSGRVGFLVLGSVFLVVTGGEALYADMGHFGRRPIRIVWFAVVLPALLLNYFGQGALLLERPAAIKNPFYLLAPQWALVPLVVLAAAATVIASQALISGAFSLTSQAVQLGYSPRTEIRHTSAAAAGQIYIPQINWALLVCTIGLVLGFKTSSNLASAYGIAVTTTMVITTLLAYLAMRHVWRWSAALAIPVALFFLGVDLAFFGASLLKVLDGGWFPLLVGAIVFTAMTTWKRGREILGQRMRAMSVPLDDFLASTRVDPKPTRVPGTAVFMVSNSDGTPHALTHNVKHNKVLHERVVLLTAATEEIPYVATTDRVKVEALSDGFFRVVAHYGFMESPDILGLFGLCAKQGLPFSLQETTFFLGSESIFATKRPGMALWRERLFGFMSRNAQRATAFFGLPPDRVIEIGTQVEL